MNPYAILAIVVAGVVAVALAAVGLHSYNGALQGQAVAEDRAVANDLAAQQAIEGQKHMVELVKEADSEAEASSERRRAAEDVARQSQEAYDALRKSDKSADDFLNLRIPDSVRRLRPDAAGARSPGASGPVRSPAGAVPAASGG